MRADSNPLVYVGILAPADQGYYRDIVIGLCTLAATHGWVIDQIPTHQPDWKKRNRHDVFVVTSQMRHVVPEDAIGAGKVVAADMDMTHEGVPSVMVDNVAVGRIAAEHLIGKGFRSLAIFAERGSTWSADRVSGFQVAARAAGLHCYEWVRANDDPRLFVPNWANPEDMTAWLRSLPKPTGLFAACDAWARGVADCARGIGLRIPEDLAIVGVDNDEYICETAVPPLSSVGLPMRRLGTEVAIAIDRMLRKLPLAQRKIMLDPTGVVARRSTDMLAVDDPDVAAALVTIRRHSDRPLTVKQILKEVPTYQHRLERGFRRCLGRTMLEEIRRVHVERAKHLLATTELPMTEIAYRSGFPDSTKLAHAFKRETGVSPRRYRSELKPGRPS